MESHSELLAENFGEVPVVLGVTARFDMTLEVVGDFPLEEILVKQLHTVECSMESHSELLAENVGEVPVVLEVAEFDMVLQVVVVGCFYSHMARLQLQVVRMVVVVEQV
jgi:hypothetical protein